MNRVSLRKGKMLVFPVKNNVEGIKINVVSQRFFYMELLEYLNFNFNYDDVEFTYKFGQNGFVTIWCKNKPAKVEDEIEILVAVVPSGIWVYWGWMDKGETLPVHREGKILQFPGWLEDILDS